MRTLIARFIAIGLLTLGSRTAAAQCPTTSFAAPGDYRSLGTNGASGPSLVLADFNRDGYLDIVTTMPVGQTVVVAVMLGGPDGHLGATATYPLGAVNPQGIASADFNGDGYRDIAVSLRQVGLYDSGGLAILLGDGAGHFGTVTRSSSGRFGNIVVTDFNADGKVDLLVAGVDLNQVVIFRGDGTGQFTETRLSVAGSANAVAAGDFNGDGKPDIAVAVSTPNLVTVFLGTGGGFAAPISVAVSDWPDSIAAADLNGDGMVDVALANYRTSAYGTPPSTTTTVLLGDGTGSFSSVASFEAGFLNTFVTIGDVNADGKLDLALAGGDGLVSVLLGDGTGSFAAALQSPAGYPYVFAVGDLNQDGRLDLAVAAYGGIATLRGDGQGRFGPYLTLPVQTPSGFAVGDFNGDGKPDVASATNVQPRKVIVYPGDGAGGFGDSVTTSLSGDLSAVMAADSNNDGKLDLIGIGSGDHFVLELLVLLGNGAGAFGPAISTNVAAGAPVAVADFNGDGKLDVVVGDPNASSGTINLVLGDGTGHFGPPTSFAVGVQPSVILAADVNNDGKTDVIVSGRYDVFVLLGTGAGSFGLARSFPTGPSGNVGIADVVAGDFNGDGKLDLAVANYGGPTSVLLGTGSGTFSAPVLFGSDTGSGVNTPSGLVTADFNGDGDLDLAVWGDQPSAVAILLGDGLGAFGVDKAFLTGPRPRRLLAADFNGDNKPDLAAMSFQGLSSDGISILLNGCSPPANLPTVSVNDVSVSEGAGGTTQANFTATLSSPSIAPVTVYYTTADGTATAGVDYTAVSGTLTFPPGTTTQIVSVSVIGDTTPEPDESFFVDLNVPVNASLAESRGVGIILDDDAGSGSPLVSISDPAQFEGHSGSTLIAFTVSLSRASASTVTASFQTQDAAAVAVAGWVAGSVAGSVDYTARSGTVTFGPGQVTRSIVVLVIGDTVVQSNRTFQVKLTGAVNATLAKDVGTATIVDDDPPTAASLISMYRLYSDNLTFEHLYTTDLNEYNVLGAGYNPTTHVGWLQEGIAYNLLNNGGTYNGAFGIALYRLYNTVTRQHHWTTDSNEALVLSGQVDWNYEGIVGYLLPQPTSATGVTPLYRLWDTGALHLWTTDLNEKDVLSTQRGWIYEGTIGNVIP
jgi:hypothetical protein